MGVDVAFSSGGEPRMGMSLGPKSIDGKKKEFFTARASGSFFWFRDSLRGDEQGVRLMFRASHALPFLCNA